MKSTGYILRSEPEQSEFEKLAQLINPNTLRADVRDEAMIHAGLDRYVAGVGFLKLTGPWRGHPKDALVVRHLNSGGMNLTVCESSEPAAAPIAETAPPAPDAAAAAAAAKKAAEELEQKRLEEQQRQAAANENKESPAPATPATTSNG